MANEMKYVAEVQKCKSAKAQKHKSKNKGEKIKEEISFGKKFEILPWNFIIDYFACAATRISRKLNWISL